MRIRWLTLLLAIGLPLAARGETIYSSWAVYSAGGVQLTRFDSESPGWRSIRFRRTPVCRPIFPRVRPLDERALGLRLLSLQHPLPSSARPGPHRSADRRIFVRPLAGTRAPVPPGSRHGHRSADARAAIFRRLDRELQLLARPPEEPFGRAARPAVLCRSLVRTSRPSARTPGVETYVIGRLATPGRAVSGAPWYQLARIGGPGGRPAGVLGAGDSHRPGRPRRRSASGSTSRRTGRPTSRRSCRSTLPTMSTDSSKWISGAGRSGRSATSLRPLQGRSCRELPLHRPAWEALSSRFPRCRDPASRSSLWRSAPPRSACRGDVEPQRRAPVRHSSSFRSAPSARGPS